MKIIHLLQSNPHGCLVFACFLLVIAVTTEARALSEVKNQLQIELPEIGSKLSSLFLHSGLPLPCWLQWLSTCPIQSWSSYDCLPSLSPTKTASRRSKQAFFLVITAVRVKSLAVCREESKSKIFKPHGASQLRYSTSRTFLLIIRTLFLEVVQNGTFAERDEAWGHFSRIKCRERAW